MRSRINFIMSTILGAFLLMPSAAFAQIGPNLIPPGLDPDHPLDAYSKDSKKRIDDWRHEASWELNANDVVFSAAKKRQLISEAPSTIHVITDREIAAHGWRSLPEILRHVPGVQTLTTKSQFKSVMIRGLVGTEDNNSRILWLQNGVPMNDVRDSGIWLDETYPVEMIKRIEVVLGPGSALYGSGAFQGVINIFTKDPNDIDKYGEYRLSIQNNLTFKASAIAAYTSESGDFGVLGHVSGNTTQGPGLIGDYVYNTYAMSQAADNISANGGATDMRAASIDNNSDKHWYNIDFKLNYKSFKWNLGFTDIYAGADGTEIVPNIDTSTLAYDKNLAGGIVSRDELPEGNAYTANDRYLYRFNRREFFTDFIYEDNFGDSVSFLSVLAYRLNHYDNQHYRNYHNAEEVEKDYCDQPSKCDFKGYQDKVNFDTMQHKLYGLAQVQWRIYEANELIAGLVLEYQHITTPEFMNGQGSISSKDADIDKNIDATTLGQLTPSIFLQDEQRFWNDRIILTAGARFDAYRIYASGDKSPDYAPSWRFAFLGKWTDWMTMRLSYGYSFKEPSLYQLYIDTFDYRGTPDLKPETLHNVELSFLFTPTYFMKIRLDTFATLMNNLIIMQYDSNYSLPALGEAGRFVPNQKEGEGANIFGFELSLDTSIGPNWNLYTHYNFLYSYRTYSDIADQNTSDANADSSKIEVDQIVPDDAMHRFKLGATYMNDYLAADLAFFLVGGTPTTKSNSGWKSRNTYATPLYAIFQPQVTVGLPHNLGIMLQGSYAFSEGMTESPTYKFYYEKENIPVSRYSVMFSLMYPFKK
ncbi:MAG: TonB-dependent receptor [Proteobacteria bacterium]|nr:TonB-dependent receptor [Pseudomonadota bacterium]